jgi:hypothetical protein
MKLISIVAVVIAPLSLLAQSNTIEDSPESTLDWWARDVIAEALSLTNARPIQVGVSYTGIAMQLIRAEHPLQLLNPLAPKGYGTGEQNVIFDMVTKQPVGLKLLSFNF